MDEGEGWRGVDIHRGEKRPSPPSPDPGINLWLHDLFVDSRHPDDLYSVYISPVTASHYFISAYPPTKPTRSKTYTSSISH